MFRRNVDFVFSYSIIQIIFEVCMMASGELRSIYIKNFFYIYIDLKVPSPKWGVKKITE